MFVSRSLPAISASRPLYINNRVSTPLSNKTSFQTSTALFALFPPLINDISSDLLDPPGFRSVTRRPLPEPFKAQIEQGYPDLKSLEVEGKAGEVFDKALQVAKEQPRWEVTLEDKAKGAIEGVATTALLQFKDDFAIRVKQGKSNVTVVDMRSKSRTGQGDFGANAARIQAYFQALKIKL